MNALHHAPRVTLAAALFLVAALWGGATLPAYGDEIKIKLSGDQEVPPVTSMASGSGSIFINANKQVSGAVTTSGVAGTMAHIHMGGSGKNGPVVIPLTKAGDNNWAVPPGAALSDAQYDAYKAGDLYVNVHSMAHPGGEIRAQIKP